MSLFGVPVIYGIKPHTSETVPSHNLGTVGVDNAGRRFRYVLAGEALVVGNVIQSKAENTSDQGLAVAAAAIGAKELTTTSTVTVSANEYAGGYIVVTITPGLGHSYRIKSHPAATAAVVVLTLEDPIVVALTTDSRIDLVANPFSNVIQNPTTFSSNAVGVACFAIPSGSYGWIQSGGIAGVLSDAGTTVGQSVVASNGTAGSVEDVASTTQQVIGVAAAGIASGENGAIFLTID